MSDNTRLGANALGDISISITGQLLQLTGWAGLQVVRAIDSAADGFSFSFPWEATEANRAKWVAYRTTSCVVSYRGVPVVTGIIEKIAAAWSPNRRELSVEGRSLTGSLLDLSAPPTEITADFNTIARQLSPNVSVTASPNIQDLTVQIEAGKSVYDVVSSIAAGHGYWARPQANGSLLFSKIRTQSPVARITEGDAPIISIDTAHDLSQRFYRYQTIVTTDGTTTKGEAIDRGVDPARDGKIIQVQSDANPIEAANFARSRGIIDSYTCLVTVAGWTVDGVLWAPGQTVSIEAPSAMIYNRSTLIIKRVTMQLDESGGAVTQLDLTFPQVYAGGDITSSFPYPWSLA